MEDPKIIIITLPLKQTCYITILKVKSDIKCFDYKQRYAWAWSLSG